MKKNLLAYVLAAGLAFGVNVSCVTPKVKHNLEEKVFTWEEEAELFYQKMLKVKDENGNPVFDRASSDAYKAFGGTLEYAQALYDIKDEEGKAVFKANHIVKACRSGLSLDYAKGLAEIGIEGFRIYRFWQLGVAKDELLGFKDTEKPNALVVYPAKDNGPFENDYSVRFFKKVKENYDVYVVIASKEREVYNALSWLSNVKLLILSGHGNDKFLNLGAGSEEEYRIDVFDTELEGYLDKLDSDAVIFLDSCSTAEGGLYGDNLANFVIKKAKGRKVIASKVDYTAEDVKVISMHPFDVKIICYYRDHTYSNK